jgi:hypothetical protein
MVGAPRWDRAPTLGLGLVLAIVLLGRPIAYGVPGWSVAFFWAWALLGIGGSGAALCWAVGLFRGDLALLLGHGLALGMALHGLLFLAGRGLGVSALPIVLPLLALTAILCRRRSAEDPAAVVPAGPGLLLVVLLGCALQPLATVRQLGEPFPVDLLFHSGNTAEVRHRWPLEDPRMAGMSLNYPVLAYAIPSEASTLTGLPVADCLLGLSALLWIGLLALQTYNVGRVLLGDQVGAALGATILLLHEDPGALLGLGRGAFLSTLDTALYGSPTTVCGLVLLASLALVVAQVFADPRRRKALLALLMILALAASLTKATILPPAAGGCALVAAWAFRQGRRDRARIAVLLASLLAATAVPFTLRLGTGDTSYRGILRWDAGAIVRHSPFASVAGHAFGLSPDAASWLVPVIAPAWLAGYLGLAGLGALLFVVRRREPLTEGQIFAIGVAVAGLVPALLLDAHGFSQIFFLYNGQLLLGILAGGAMAGVLRRPSVALVLVLGLATLPPLDKARRVLAARPNADMRAASVVRDPTVEAYGAGLAWLRAHAARGAIVFADNPSLLLSAFGECQMYYETGLFTPRGWEERWRGASEPYPERAAFQESLLRRPTAEVAAEARRLFPAPTEILVVADSVQSKIEAGFVVVDIGPVPGRPLLSPAFFRPAFTNHALHVYRLAAAAEGPAVLPGP